MVNDKSFAVVVDTMHVERASAAAEAEEAAAEMSEEDRIKVEGFIASWSYIREHMAELRRDYLGQCIAVYGGKLVDHDPDCNALTRKVFEKYGRGESFMVLIERIGEEPKHAYAAAGASRE